MPRTHTPEHGHVSQPRAREPEPAPRLPERASGLTIQRILALQRAGAGNHAISRVLARHNGDVVIEEVEEETDEAPQARGGESDVGDGQPLLLTDRPWSEMFPPPLPLAQPASDFGLPVVVPRAEVPPEARSLFDPEAPAPAPGPPVPVPIEHKPLVPEEPEQDEVETEEAPDPAKKKRKRKKKKPGAAAAPEGSVPTAPAPTKTAAPPPQPQVAAPVPLDDLDALEASIKAAGKQTKDPAQSGKKTKAKGQQQQPKAMTARQKEHARKEKERLNKKAIEDQKLKELDAQHAAEALVAETTARGALITKLGIQKDQLATARSTLPEGYDESEELYEKAGLEVTALTTYLAGDGKTATSATLKARSDAVALLLTKVKGYKPPLTAKEIRQKKWNEVQANVPNEFSKAKWEGAFGGETSFKVDKNDKEMRKDILAYFGKDQYEIPGHQTKTYPGKSPTSKVYYYVTGTSNTPYIAYDITAHVWDDNVKVGTVHVLHIPHGT